MKIRKFFTTYFVIGAAVLSAAAGCSHSQASDLANEITCSLEGISQITISYDEETITFYQTEKDELLIKEYMTKNKSSYHAKVKQSGDSIKISEGGKPFFKGNFSRCVEVYLPAEYQEALTVTTTNGTIDITEPELVLNTLYIESTSGTLLLNAAKARDIHLATTGGRLDAGSLDADTIRIDTTSGDFSCEKLTGNVTYTTTSGNADIESALGQGKYTANNSGELHVVYTEVTGDLSFFNKNDNIVVSLPADLSFIFDAKTKNGTISTSFPQYISGDGQTADGTVGEHPTVTVRAETKNGNIEILQ